MTAMTTTSDQQTDFCEEAAIYARDGAVCVRKVFDRGFMEALAPVALDMRLNPAAYPGLPNVTHPRYMARFNEDMRKLAFDLRLGEVAAKVMGSRQINFFFDELFTKAPHSDLPTMWHNDRAGWPVSGEMIPSIWMPLTPICRENCLEVIAGSQRHDTLYWLYSPNGRKMIKPADRPLHANAEKLRGEEGMRFLRWEMEPGDVLFVHPWAMHYSSGNPTDEYRIAISTRVFGDDVRWDPRPECLNIAGVCFDEMVPGERPGGTLFPALWDDGPVNDPGATFPRGFATEWSPEAYQRLHDAQLQKSGFKGLLDKDGGAQDDQLDKLRADILRGQ